MQPVLAVLWVCMAGVVLRGAATTEGVKETALWRSISVESSWLQSAVTQTPRNLSLILCGAACMRQEWCSLWCHEAPRECLLTSVIASASYKPAQPVGALSCYTTHLPDLAVGAAITSSPPRYADQRHKENLVDGIYGGLMSDCARVEALDATTPWFLLDIGASVPVNEVILVAQPNSNAPKHLGDVEVRVGDVQMAGDFTTYQLLGTFPGPAVPEQTVVLRPAPPLTGRYISIQRATTETLQIAHLEIR